MHGKHIAILSVLACTICVAQRPQRDASAQSQTHVLIVSGINRDSGDLAERARTLDALRRNLFEKSRVDPAGFTMLTAEDAQPATDGAGSTAQNVRRAIDALASAIRPQDRFVLFYLGQANVAGGDLRLNLPGPDITQKDLAATLGAIRAERQLVVLDCPCAALAAKALAAEGRIIVCASTAEQTYATQFTTHFAGALNGSQSDASGDGRLSLLEAFTAAARSIERWYRDRQVLPTETPCLEDDGDGAPGEQPWRYQAVGGDGAKAAAFMLAEEN